MNCKDLLLLMRINPGEGKLVGLNFLFAVLIGMVMNFTVVIPLTLFLNQYPSHLLAYVFMFSGGIIFLTGFTFSYLEKKLSFFSVLGTLLITLALSLVIFWILLEKTESRWLAMTLIIWANTLQNFLGIIFGSLMLEIFTLQQNKRLFGIIGSGQALGGSISGLAIPFLTSFVGIKNIILLSAIILMISVISLYAIKFNWEGELTEQRAANQSSQNPFFFKQAQNKKYLFFVFALNLLVTFFYFSFDLFFNTEVKTHFHNETQIADFLGVTSAVSYVLYLIAGFFCFGWVLTRLGLIISLLIYPVLIGIFIFILLLIFDSSFASEGFIFAMVTFIVLCERMLRVSISKQSLLLFFQPLNRKERSWAQIQNRALVNPIATSLIGIILIGIGHVFGININSMSFFILTMCVLSICFVFFTKKEYIAILLKAVSKRVIIDPDLTTLDKESLGVFKHCLTSPFPEEVIYFLQTVENVNRNEFVAAIEHTLNHPSRAVRVYSLGKVEKYKIRSALAQVKQIYLADKDSQVVSAASLAWAAIADSRPLSFLMEQIENPNREIAGSSIVALIKYGVESEQRQALQLLMQKASSPDESDRLMAAHILKETPTQTNRTTLLQPLLCDPSVEVKLAACEASMHLVDENLVPLLVENLAISHTCDSASNALLSMGLPFFYYISKKFEDFDRNRQIKLIDLLGFLKPHKHVIEFLKGFVFHSDRRLVYSAVKSLKKQSYKAKENDPQFSKLLASESKYIEDLEYFLHGFDSENTRLLYSLVLREIEISQEMIFLILTFKYHTESIVKAMEAFETESEDMKSYSIEILLNLLSSSESKLIEHRLVVRPTSKNKDSVENYMLKIIDKAQTCFIPAIASAAIYTIGILGLKNLADFVLAFEATEDPLIHEVKPWTLQKLSDSSRCFGI